MLLIGVIAGVQVLGFAAWLEYRPGPLARLIGFLLSMAASPWLLLLFDTLGVKGYWAKLFTLWTGLTINLGLLVGAVRWLQATRDWRRANLARRGT
jgi:hypothetical protein